MLREEYLRADEVISQCMAAAAEGDQETGGKLLNDNADDESVSSDDSSDIETDEELEADDDEGLETVESATILDDSTDIPTEIAMKGFARPKIVDENLIDNRREQSISLSFDAQESKHNDVYSYDDEMEAVDQLYPIQAVPISTNNTIISRRGAEPNGSNTIVIEDDYPKFKQAKISSSESEVNLDSNGSSFKMEGNADIHSVTLNLLQPVESNNLGAINNSTTEFAVSDEELLAMLEALESSGVLIPHSDSSDCTNNQGNRYITGSNPQGILSSDSKKLKRYSFFPVPNDSAPACFSPAAKNKENIPINSNAMEISIRTTSAKKHLNRGGRLAYASIEQQQVVSDEEMLLALERFEASQLASVNLTLPVHSSVQPTEYSSCAEVPAQQGLFLSSTFIYKIEDQIVSANGVERKSPIVQKTKFLQSIKKNLPFHTEKRKVTVSPYLTPFTASKVSSSGKYLYCPLTERASQGRSRSSLLTLLRHRLPNGSPSNQKQKQTDFDSNPFHSIDIAQHINKEAPAICLHVQNNDHCKEFLNRLANVKCLSFELIFRRFKLFSN